MPVRAEEMYNPETFAQGVAETLSSNAKLNLYLFLGKLSIGTEYSELGARKYKNNCAQALKRHRHTPDRET